MFRKGLSRSVILVIVAAGCLVLAGFGAVLFPFESGRRQARLEQAGQLMVAIYQDKKDDLANEMFGGKMIALDRSMSDMRKFRGVVAVSVFDVAGRLVRSTSGHEAESMSSSEIQAMGGMLSIGPGWLNGTEMLVLSTPVEVMGEHMGYLRMYHSRAEIDRETVITLASFLVLQLLMLVLMIVILAWMLNRLVLTPVKELNQAMGRVRDGRLGEQVDFSGSHEMADMARSFNAMSLALEDAIQGMNDAALKLEEANRELSGKAAELEDANQRLLEVDRLKSAFLSSVSHELRTPLTSVRGFAKLIRKDFGKLFLPGTGDGRRKADRMAGRIDTNLEIIVTESERLSQMIDDVLDLSRIEEGRMQWRDETVDPGAVVERAARNVVGLFAEKAGLVLDIRVEPDLPVLRVDPDRVLQVLINLLSNSAKFADEGLVEVRAQTGNNGNVRFSVSDQGAGIDPRDLSVIFDTFQQSARGRSKPKGSGLGLAISRQIVEHYGGRIWAESTLGQGCVVHVELPAVQA